MSDMIVMHQLTRADVFTRSREHWVVHERCEISLCEAIEQAEPCVMRRHITIIHHAFTVVTLTAPCIVADMWDNHIELYYRSNGV